MRFLAPPPRGDVVPGPRPTFSVIVAAYQRADVVGEAVRSALEQEPPPLEIVVCDDGSTDDLAGALAEFGDQVRLVRIEHGGEAAAKNAAARATSGDFVVNLDADDVFLPGRLDAMGQLAAERPDLDLITTDAYLEADGNFIGRCYHAGNRFTVDDQRRAILEANFIFGLAAVRRRRLVELGGFDETAGLHTDWDCWIRVILSGGRAGLVDTPLAAYRLHPAAMSSDRLTVYRGRVGTLRKASTLPGLTEAEQRVVARRMAEEEARLEVEEAQVALAAGASDARRRAWSVAVTGQHRMRTRLKAAAAAVAPRTFGSRLRERDAETWRGVGDIRLPTN